MSENRKPKEPPYDEGEKCFHIRKRSKSGGVITAEELVFCCELMKRYPEWYAELDKRVFNATVPFGSFARME